MHAIQKFALLITGAVLVVSVIDRKGCLAAPIQTPPAESVNSAPMDINVLEQRFFSQRYDKEPLEKRLQRLELLLFGYTQEGTLPERLERLRDTAQRKSAGSQTRFTPGPGPAASNQSARISALEKKILKKTYTGESTDHRINRLEEKVFGKATSSLPAADRLERLSKIVGIPDSFDLSDGSPNMMPGRGNGMVIPFGAGRFGGGRLGGQSGGSAMIPFGQGSGFFDEQMNEMLRQMHRDLPRMQQMPRSQPMPPMQSRPQPMTSPSLPPYLDPNSI